MVAHVSARDVETIRREREFDKSWCGELGVKSKRRCGDLANTTRYRRAGTNYLTLLQLAHPPHACMKRNTVVIENGSDL